MSGTRQTARPAQPGIGGSARTGRPSPMLGYGIAIGGVALTVALQAHLAPLVGGHAFLFFFPTVILTAWYGGRGPAVLAAGLAVVAVNYFFLLPGDSFRFEPLAQGVQLVLFLGTAYLVGSTTSRLQEARAQAERSRRQLEALVATAADGIAVIDGRGILRRVNAAAEKIFGYDEDELLGRNVSILMPEPYRSEHDAYLERYLRTGEAGIIGIGREVRGRRKDGTTFPLELAVSEATFGDDVLFTGIVRDVTERKWAEVQERLLAQAGEILTEALEVDEALQRIAVMCTRTFADYCVTYVLEDEDRIRRVGVAHAAPAHERLVRRLLDLSDLSLGDAYGAGQVMRTGEDVFAPEIPDELLERAAQDEEHLELLRGLRPLSSIVLPFRARGRTLGAISLTTSTWSGRHYTDADLDTARELARRVAMGLDNLHLLHEARSAAAVRDDLVAVVSHDLRDSLNVVLSAARLLRELDLDEAQRMRQLDALIRAAGAMEHLTSDLLDVARMEAGLFSIDPEPMALADLMSEVLERHRPAFDAKGICLEIQAPDTIPEIRADRWRLLQLLGNLLGNALKFTPEGGSVHLTAATHRGSVTLCVRDSGPGIPREEIPLLFDRFFRGTRPGSGTGLGLTIARGIALAHGGEIRVDSEPGEGTSFEVVLPGTSKPAPVAEPAAEGS